MLAKEIHATMGQAKRLRLAALKKMTMSMKVSIGQYPTAALSRGVRKRAGSFDSSTGIGDTR
jgi:hypothetical protein